MPGFVHLHTHSEYSLLDGHARISRLVQRAVDVGQEALALTDHGAMFGAVEFYRAATKRGIKPIIGCETYFTPNSRLKREGKEYLYHLLLLAKNETGYHNLMAIVSEASTRGFYYKPRVDFDLLEQYHEGLVCTSACMSGIVSKSIEQGDLAEARRWAEKYAGLFGSDFYLEIQEQGIVADNGVTQKQLTAEIARMGEEMGVGLVGTNDIHYVLAADHKAQDLLLCVGTGSTIDDASRLRFSSDQFYLKSAEEMEQVLGGYPEALSNTLSIANDCDITLEFDRIILPKFEPEDGSSEDEFLRAQCARGLEKRYGLPVPAEARERLETELEVITTKGLSAYFLIVADFVKWAKDNNIGVGPGRGSAAGSIISYALGITNLDPLEHGLLFERFLNPERTEMPDIDIDFDDERRLDVIEYVRHKYGDDRVAQVVTYSTMKARAAIRDAGRVLGYPYSTPDKVAKLVPERIDRKGDEDKHLTDLEVALRDNAELREGYESNADYKSIIDAALSLENVVRGEGIHAAAVVICRDPLHHYTPVKLDTKGGSVITQYEGSVIADLGLLKMDFLGLRTLTVLAKAVAAIEQHHGVTIDLDAIPMDDKKTWSLLQRADSDGVFQVESPGMKRVLRDLRPTCFADLVAVVALFRPGPMDSINDFIARKHGKTAISYYDDRIKHILEETYGAIVYQEQAMLITMEMGGFSAAKADKLRKGMGKKKMEIVDALESEFMAGAAERRYDPVIAGRVWSDMRKFGEYAFNKSHAAAYGLLAYQTAYLKAHYPLEYMAAVLTSYMGKSETIVKYVAACNQGGMKVLPPDVNSSGKDFTAVEKGIRFGLAGIKGVGEGVVESIVAERKTGGPYGSLQDFCNRVDMKQLNKKMVEALIKAGAFDSTGYTRKHLMLMIDSAVDAAVKKQKDADAGQTSMFDLLAAEDHGMASSAPSPNGDEWDKGPKLKFEKDVLGIYVSDHPLREIADVIIQARTMSLAATDEFRDKQVAYFAGIVNSVERIATKAGKMMATFVLEDLESTMVGVLFPKDYDRYRDIVVPDAVVRIKAKIERSERGLKLIVLEVEPLSADGQFERSPGVLMVRADLGLLGNGGGERFKEILARYPGRDAVQVELRTPEGTKQLKMGDEYKVNSAAAGLHAELKELLGGDAVWDA
ncbi:MAG: DNA polymerase III subunit alpha [Actinobacteria bacterium]|nr:DNA polymerase III subunit alpha [Actinomycetota bacterium]